jgi:hypothetical protein
MDLHNIIVESIHKVLNEGYYDDEWDYSQPDFNDEGQEEFDEREFEQWEEDNTIPQETMDIVRHVCDKIGCDDIPEEETIPLRNRGGYVYGYAKGFTLSYCTSSLENGPSVDYSKPLLKFIKGLGFRISRSYGDNGMDPSTNTRDTYWNYDFIYEGEGCKIYYVD